jgi:co-chaperonin GroES (HSP10)
MTPLSNHYLVRRVPSEDRIGALIIPEAYREKSQMFEVLACGPGRVLDDGTRHPMQAEAGDGVVVLERYFNALPDSTAREYWCYSELAAWALENGWSKREWEDSEWVDHVEWTAPDGRTFTWEGESSFDFQRCDEIDAALRALIPSDLGFIRDDHLIAVDRGDGPEPAGDYVQVVRDVREREQELPSGLLVAAYGLPGGEVRERESAGEAHARSYQADTRIERPRSGIATAFGWRTYKTGHLEGVVFGSRVHWERHYEAVAAGEHVYITADQLCAVEVG